MKDLCNAAIAEHGLEIWDRPEPFRMYGPDGQAPMYSMRIGDPSNGEEFWIESSQGVDGVYREAIPRIQEYAQKRRSQTETKSS